jgi:hypothetical protein
MQRVAYLSRRTNPESNTPPRASSSPPGRRHLIRPIETEQAHDHRVDHAEEAVRAIPREKRDSRRRQRQHTPARTHLRRDGSRCEERPTASPAIGPSMRRMIASVSSRGARMLLVIRLLISRRNEAIIPTSPNNTGSTKLAYADRTSVIDSMFSVRRSNRQGVVNEKVIR